MMGPLPTSQQGRPSQEVTHERGPQPHLGRCIWFDEPRGAALDSRRRAGSPEILLVILEAKGQVVIVSEMIWIA